MMVTEFDEKEISMLDMKTIDLLRAGQLSGSQRLNLAAGLTQFPAEIFDLADSLEILDLSHNHLRSLPADFGRLHKLKILFLSNNDFEEVPVVLADCPVLEMVGFKSNKIKVMAENVLPLTVRWLILTDNQLEKLPRSIGQLTKLQKLMLAGNQLTMLPDEMAACQNLELIRLAANRLVSLPAWLWELPRLSWLAAAGNPCSVDISRSMSQSLPLIPWSDLTVIKTLGEGASGVISQGLWQEGAVAIKIFKGEMTSDGLPLDEINILTAARGCPHVLAVCGKIIDHPEDRSGLVLPLMPPQYQNLGEPPSLETCTRDTYSPHTSFSVVIILRFVSRIANAVKHLHQRGIMHGDLYAHNILVTMNGEAYLGDFGAASAYEPMDTEQGQAWERLEVRAFGCLLEELLERSESTNNEAEKLAVEELQLLKSRCLEFQPLTRPLFPEIYEILFMIGIGLGWYRR
jgi:predicted Ser/Thr protein kinase